VASGFFDGASFTNALVILTDTVDSSTLQVDNPPDGFASIGLQGNATVTVGGVSDTLTGRSTNPKNGSVFNGPFALNSTALSETGNTFSGADIGFEAEILILSTNTTADYATALQGTLGPLSGRAGISAGYQFATASGGYLELDSTSSSSTIAISAAPEPGSLLLSCLGLGLASIAYRRRRL
jgi:hypothetical protein